CARSYNIWTEDYYSFDVW
nr:immunoglobulin heavy chain junction region [Macaca mulatta]MOV87083.1 immunoglobulin heavy chain junction region [Macaca mulatta]MOV87369.1 immunoglobulin heavy chain junction region [Macaca mulatta]MOV88881.1 immunoglobulin heavy chain junction region [Macaca mulatta]MOV89590.1 immunoglobulin heavy chain junction region [Macaca mulatta]